MIALPARSLVSSPGEKACASPVVNWGDDELVRAVDTSLI